MSDTYLGGVLREAQEAGLIFAPGGIALDDSVGVSRWYGEDLVEGPPCCQQCCQGFDDVEVEPGHYPHRQAVATWSELTIDMRDPEAPDSAEPEKRALCGRCRDQWRSEIVWLEMVLEDGES
jgi:hypothetical protein